MSDTSCPQCGMPLDADGKCGRCAPSSEKKDAAVPSAVSGDSAGNIDLSRERSAARPLAMDINLSGRPSPASAPPSNPPGGAAKPFSDRPDSKPPIWKNSTPAWAVGRMEPLKRVGLSQEPAWFRQHKSSKPMAEPQKTSGAPQSNAAQPTASSQPQNASGANSPASGGGAAGAAQPPAASIQQNSAAEMASAAASRTASQPERSDGTESSRVTADSFPAVSPLSGNNSAEQASATIPRREEECVSRESAQAPSSAEQNSEMKEDAGASAQTTASVSTDAAAGASAAATASRKAFSQKEAEESL